MENRRDGRKRRRKKLPNDLKEEEDTGK